MATKIVDLGTDPDKRGIDGGTYDFVKTLNNWKLKFPWTKQLTDCTTAPVKSWIARPTVPYLRNP